MSRPKKKKLTLKEMEEMIDNLLNPKEPLRVIGYFISDDGETRTEIGTG